MWFFNEVFLHFSSDLYKSRILIHARHYTSVCLTDDAILLFKTMIEPNTTWNEASFFCLASDAHHGMLYRGVISAKFQGRDLNSWEGPQFSGQNCTWKILKNVWNWPALFPLPKKNNAMQGMHTFKVSTSRCDNVT